MRCCLWDVGCNNLRLIEEKKKMSWRQIFTQLFFLSSNFFSDIDTNASHEENYMQEWLQAPLWQSGRAFESLAASTSFVTENVIKLCYRSSALEVFQVFQLCERADDIITTLSLLINCFWIYKTWLHTTRRINQRQSGITSICWMLKTPSYRKYRFIYYQSYAVRFDLRRLFPNRD